MNNAISITGNKTVIITGDNGNLRKVVMKTFLSKGYELHDFPVEVFYQKSSEDVVSIMAYDTSDKLRMFNQGINLDSRLRFKTGRTISSDKGFCA